jgi:DNA-binding phage protein
MKITTVESRLLNGLIICGIELGADVFLLVSHDWNRAIMETTNQLGKGSTSCGYFSALATECISEKMEKTSLSYYVVVTKVANKMTFKEQNSIGRSITNMRNYRTLSEVMEEYLRKHPEEIDSFVSVLFEEYAQDGDIAATLSALRVVSRVKGVSLTTESAGTSQREVEKALSGDGDPKFGDINALMHAMGYQLVPQRLQAS